MFDAFFSVYLSRTDNLFRIYRAGGRPQSDDLPGPLADELAFYACDTAQMFFRLCARALDYCLPVDLKFGDFLRALITVSKDLHPSFGIRDAFMEAFRLCGIYPENASFFSEDAVSTPSIRNR